MGGNSNMIKIRKDNVSPNAPAWVSRQFNFTVKANTKSEARAYYKRHAKIDKKRGLAPNFPLEKLK
jgi:hypothetical protein